MVYQEVRRETYARKDERKAQFIINDDRPPLSDLADLIHNSDLQRNAAIDLERFSPVFEVAIRGMDAVAIDERTTSTIKNLAYSGLGYMAANELRSILYKSGEFGRQYQIAYNHPNVSDHGHPHTTDFKKYYAALDIAIDSLVDDTGELFVASALSITPHDSQQMFRRFYNAYLAGEGVKRDPRLLHEEEGAVFMKLLSPVIAKILNVTPELAGRITTYSAVMIWCHDKHADFEKIISGTEKAFRTSPEGRLELLTDEEVFDLYSQNFSQQYTNSLDMFSLSESQWLGLFQKVRAQKELNDAITSEQKHTRRKLPVDEKSTYGFVGLLEEVSEERIKEMLISQISAIPIIPDMKDERRAQFKEFMYKFVNGDLSCMGIDAGKAIQRKATTLAHSDRKKNQNYTDFEDAIDEKKGDLMRSDWAREMYEYLMMIRMQKKSNAWNNPEYRELTVNTIANNMMKTHQYEIAFMNAYSEENWEHREELLREIVHSITIDRLEMAVRKAIEKHGAENALQFSLSRTYTEAIAQAQEVVAALERIDPENHNRYSYADRLQDAIDTLVHIDAHAATNLLKIPNPEVISKKIYYILRRHQVRNVNELPLEIQNSIRSELIEWKGYSKKDIQMQERNFIKFFRHFCGIAGIQPKEYLQLVRRSVVDGESDLLPILTIGLPISIGDEGHRSMIHSPKALQSLLSEFDGVIGKWDA